MSLFLLDTDILSLLEQGHPLVLQHVNSHPVSDIALSAISIQEQAQGFLASLTRAPSSTTCAGLRHAGLRVCCRFGAVLLSFPSQRQRSSALNNSVRCGSTWG